MHCRFLSFFPVIGVLLVLLFSACAKRKTEVVWQQNLPVIGSQSSPGAADLNGDGTLDIVMGAGKNERQDSEQGVLAFDGATGDILWQYPTHDQVFGAPAFQDLNGDGILDVFTLKRWTAKPALYYGVLTFTTNRIPFYNMRVSNFSAVPGSRIKTTTACRICSFKTAATSRPHPMLKKTDIQVF